MKDAAQAQGKCLAIVFYFTMLDVGHVSCIAPDIPYMLFIVLEHKWKFNMAIEIQEANSLVSCIYKFRSGRVCTINANLSYFSFYYLLTVMIECVYSHPSTT